MATDFVIPTGAIIQYTMRQRLDGQVMLNTFHFRSEQEVSTGLAELAALGQSLNTSLQTEQTLLQSSSVTYEASVVQMIDPVRYVAVLVDDELESNGQVATAALPTTVSLVIRRRSIIASRSGRGRIFVGGIPIASVADSQLTALPLAQANAYADLMPGSFAGGAGNNYTAVIYDRVNPENSEEIATAVTDPILRVQRRREIGVGV